MGQTISCVPTSSPDLEAERYRREKIEGGQRELEQKHAEAMSRFITECCTKKQHAFIPCEILSSAFFCSEPDPKMRAQDVSHTIKKMGYTISGKCTHPVVLGLELTKWPNVESPSGLTKNFRV